MKKPILALLAGLLFLAPLGCGGGIEPGPATSVPSAVIVPPPAEKPQKYDIHLGGRRS